MYIILIGNSTLHKLKLPTTIDGSFSLKEPETEDNLINIEAGSSNWLLVSNPDFKITNTKGEEVKKTIIKEDDYFYINYKNVTKIIYCTKLYDNTVNIYKLNSLNLNLTIGKDINNSIVYDNKCILDKHMMLSFNNGEWNLYLESNPYVYLNNRLITKNNTVLSNGDYIFSYGLKIVVLNNQIFVNNPQDKVNIKENILSNVKLENKEYRYEEVKEEDLYKDTDYFFHTPRLRRFIETYELNISNPPSIPEKKEMPLILTLGPMMTMILLSVVRLFNVLSNLLTGETTFAKSWMQLITPVVMIMGSLLWPNLTRSWQKKQQKKQNKIRKEKYSAYLEEKRQEIKAETINQMAILKDNLLVLSECYNIIINKKRILWERKNSQKDFLTVRIGIGNVPLDMKINFSKEDDFVIEKDELKDLATQMVDETKMLNQVPIGYSFFKKRITAIMGKHDMVFPFVDNIILQLITFHSYDELKIVIFTNENNESRWNIYKTLPHLFSDDKSFRFFASTSDEYKELSLYLEQEVAKRQQIKEGDFVVENEDDKKTYKPYYLIITDDYIKIRKMEICNKVFDSKDDIGFSFVILEDVLSHLPSKCNNFITIDKSFCGILKNDINDYYQQTFQHEIDATINMKKCIDVLANIPIEFEQDLRYLPTSMSFLEMYGVGKIEQLNIKNRWRLNNPVNSLRAPLGVNDQSNLIYLDLHEKYHGPHGLIAGTTGSGKSEFIITYILSMCINYNPNEVAFILIDYKGGGLAGAFENKKNNIRLPHLAGTITNLDKNELNRTLVSIQSELTRRQTKFNAARDKLGESTIDIYKYQRLFREKKLDEPMPHLFIVCDEFAELKSQQPDFMDNLISAARIGRSLGVHLILATQKPSGVVNDQIWSNTKFRVCLKVATPADSTEMIKCKDAAYIKNAGRFFLQVGQNEIFVLGQSGWAGAAYIASDSVKKEYDRSLNFINNIGEIIKTSVDEDMKNNVSLGDQLSSVLKYITDLAKKENLKAQNLWLDNISGELMLEDVIKKYNFKSDEVTAIIGEYDDPSNQFQDILTLTLNNDANTIVYGFSGNNRELFLRTFIYSLSKLYSSEDVNFYIFDFGSETFEIMLEFPHVGDVVYSSDDDKVDKMFNLIEEEMEERKKIFADYNGDYFLYCKNSGNKIPLFIIIINNYESFKEYYSKYDDLIVKLTREGNRYGIIFVITTTNKSGIYSKILKSFSNIFALDMNSKESYFDILGKIGNVYPAEFDGRGLIKRDTVYEFQTARICDDSEIVSFIKKEGELLQQKNTFKAKKVPVLPDILTLDMLSESLTSLKTIPIGMFKESLEPCLYDFTKSKANVICSNEAQYCFDVLKGILKAFKKLGNIVTVLMDFENIFEYLKSDVGTYCNQNFDNFINEILKYIDEKIVNTEYHIMIVISGVSKFKSLIQSKKISEFSKKIKSIENSGIIYVDDVNNLKQLQIEMWYIENIIKSNGIWIGRGIINQNIIKLNDFSKKYYEKINNDFGWYVKNGEGEQIKLISGDN